IKTACGRTAEERVRKRDQRNRKDDEVFHGVLAERWWTYLPLHTSIKKRLLLGIVAQEASMREFLFD
ncbi:MAG TPA: hypothetical protein VFG14_10290, partial [Chthoniobacteraceae bacterium]|nr:hypothetical protein [Chthoniobacteraceae bacterium]